MITSICIFWFLIGVCGVSTDEEKYPKAVFGGIILMLVSSIVLIAVYWP